MSKPDCYKCRHRRPIPGDCHSTCINKGATVKGNKHGIRSGWFAWPWNFDPTWLIECDGFSDKSVSAAVKEESPKSTHNTQRLK